MTRNSRQAGSPGPWALYLSLPILCLAVLMVVPEVILSLADAGLVGTRQWRIKCYGYGAFWTGLLYDWTVNYAGQPVVMFVSHGFLHIGPWHLLGNLAGLIWLGGLTQQKVGTARFLLLYALATLGGALFYAVIVPSPTPMVGASGALFGLAGALAFWRWEDNSAPVSAGGLGPREAAIDMARIIGFFVVINVVHFYASEGAVAWQTHLGGFILGALGAALITPPAPPGSADDL